MTSKFVESFLVAGLGNELRPEGIKKNLLCGVKDIVLVRGHIEQVQITLASEENISEKLKFMRFMTLSAEHQIHIAIQYSHPFKGEEASALFGIELIRKEGGFPANKVEATQGNIVRTIQVDQIQTPLDIFDYEKASPQTINCLIQDTKGFDYYIGKDIRSQADINPINELHLHPIPDGCTSIKMPNGYRMVFSLLLHLDGVSHYLIKRQRNDPEWFRYKAEILSCYPSISQGASINSLKLLFPNGCRVVSKPSVPVHQTCYITLDESSLDHHMLTFIKYTEKTSHYFAENYAICNFIKYKPVYIEKAIGFISKHYDNRTSERLLSYLYEYINSPSVSLPIEVDLRLKSE